jgi:cytochrome b6-f complex iron-sulfur subunit
MSDPTPTTPGSAPQQPAPAPAPAAAAPAAPKPAPKAPAKAKDSSRRDLLFMSWFAFAWTTMAGSLGLMTLGTLRFLFPNVLSEPPSKVKVGLPESFEEGKVVEKFKDQNIWVVRYEGKIYALSTTCTHLGCTPNWLEGAAKFKCPCHGSGFYISGINFEGPAPRPLERWALSVGDDGQIVVDKSKKFQQERGEWTNPESFITV